MHSFTYAALVLSQNAPAALPQEENNHFVLKFIGCFIVAVLCRVLWSSLEKHGGAIGLMFAWIPMVGFFIFGFLTLYNLVSGCTAGEPYSGPSSG